MNCKISVRYVECRVKDHFLRGGVPNTFSTQCKLGQFLHLQFFTAYRDDLSFEDKFQTLYPVIFIFSHKRRSLIAAQSYSERSSVYHP